MVHSRNAVALAVLLVLAGCTGGVDPSSSTGSAPRTETRSAPPAASSGPDVRLPILPAGGDSIHVASVGVLEVDGPCLYLRASDGTQTLPVFAIEQVRWNRGAGMLEAGNRSYRPGQSVTLTGNPADGPPAGVAWVQAPDPACNAQRVFVASSIQ